MAVGHQRADHPAQVTYEKAGRYGDLLARLSDGVLLARVTATVLLAY